MKNKIYISEPGIICSAGTSLQDAWKNILSGNQSGIKKVFGATKNIFSPNKNEINITEYSDKMYSTPDESFVDTIKNTKYEDLIKQVK